MYIRDYNILILHVFNNFINIIKNNRVLFNRHIEREEKKDIFLVYKNK
jgi:hypothetical protein